MSYQLLDSGDFAKLEQFGDFRLVRPALNAVWAPRLQRREWAAAGVFTRDSSGGGSWSWRVDSPPESWSVAWEGMNFKIKPTHFGHLGVFPEQFQNWRWLENAIASPHFSSKPNILNLFAYSGLGSLKMAAAGAEVCHVDAAKGMIAWGRENLTMNPNVPNRIRWIVDDVMKFVNREIRRGRTYHGVVLDPPSFGRGPRGQVWKLEDHLLTLLRACRNLLEPKGSNFVLLSCHSPGFTPVTLARALLETFDVPDSNVESGEMVIPEPANRFLPAGCFARFLNAP